MAAPFSSGKRGSSGETRFSKRERSRELYVTSGRLPTSVTYDPAKELHRYALAYALRDGLFEDGFLKQSFHKEFKSGECIYLKPVKPHVYVTVYSTIRFHECRAKSTDAIRVVGLYETTSGARRPLVKTERVFRKGRISSVVARTLERVAKVEAALKGGIKEGKIKICPRSDCDAPMFLSSKGRWVCSELCFKRDRSLSE